MFRLSLRSVFGFLLATALLSTSAAQAEHHEPAEAAVMIAEKVDLKGQVIFYEIFRTW
jgi:hypothetical protein